MDFMPTFLPGYAWEPPNYSTVKINIIFFSQNIIIGKLSKTLLFYRLLKKKKKASCRKCKLCICSNTHSMVILIPDHNAPASGFFLPHSPVYDGTKYFSVENACFLLVTNKNNNKNMSIFCDYPIECTNTYDDVNDVQIVITQGNCKHLKVRIYQTQDNLNSKEKNLCSILQIYLK